jgi:hypothetical protein
VFGCEKCDVELCVYLCFEGYHTELTLQIQFDKYPYSCSEFLLVIQVITMYYVFYLKNNSSLMVVWLLVKKIFFARDNLCFVCISMVFIS